MSVSKKLIIAIVLFLTLAIGLVLLFDIGGFRRACAPVPEGDQHAYITSMELSRRANEAFKARNYPVANDLLDLAIMSLGSSYATSSSTDDTASVLLAAKSEVMRSDFQMATRMKQGALNTRLAAFRKKTEMARRCQAVLRRFSQ